MSTSIAVVFTVCNWQEWIEGTHMRVRLFCAFYLRKFSTNRGEICFGVALNTLEEIPSHPSNRMCPYYEVCIKHCRFLQLFHLRKTITFYVKYWSCNVQYVFQTSFSSLKCLVFFSHSYTFVTHQQMHTDKIYFIVYYYLPTYFGSSATIIRVSHKKAKNIQQLHKLHNQNHPMLQYFSMHGHRTYKVIIKKKRRVLQEQWT